MEGITISKEIYDRLNYLGLIPNEVRKDNVGKSNYSKQTIQPWSIWLDYNLNAWDADIVKRVLRTKEEAGMSEKEARLLDYNKIIHICKERIRQLESEPLATLGHGKYTVTPETQQVIEDLINKTYILNEKEYQAYNTFKDCHKECNKDCDRGVEVSFGCNTGIGTHVYAFCPGCNTEEDLTDYSEW